MKKPVTYLGDAFFYILSLFAILTFIWIIITPAKYFVANEFQKLFENKGELRAKSKFNTLLAKHNITRENFKPSIIIRKRNRELSVYSGSIEIASYVIGIGRNAIGRKQKKDDLKTPEGNYYICDKKLNHKYHLFLQINYPSSEDASRATINHIISTTDEIHINQAEENGNPPPNDTELGGNVGIHGFGSESSWTTDGSISMNNIDVEDIFWNIENGCSVMILP